MLHWRLSLGALLIGALVGLCWLDYYGSRPCQWLFPLAVLLTLASAGEVVSLLASRGFHPRRCLVLGANLLLVASNGVAIFWGGSAVNHTALGRLACPLLALTIGAVSAFAVEVRRYDGPGDAIVRVAWSIFSLAYIGLMFSFMVQLRVLDGNDWGMVALASLIVTVKLGDTGAYAVGRILGRHKLAPKLSPGKTIEGLVGGLGASCLGSWLVFEKLAPELVGVTPSRPWWSWAVFGVVVGAAGVLGDLAESLFKRDMGRKDSSTWMPGFGGVLDIVDSLLLAAPVAYLCWIAGLVGPGR